MPNGVLLRTARNTPRKRPRQERSKATVDAILTAAAKVLHAEGVEGATTNRIAELAGVSIGSLYQYFPSKDALVAALIDAANQKWRETFEAKVVMLWKEDLAVAARALVGELFRGYQENIRLHQILQAHLPLVGRMEDVRRLREDIGAMVRAALESRREELVPKNLDLAVFIMVRTVDALADTTLHERPHLLANEELVDEVTDMVLCYLTSPRPPRKKRRAS